MLRWTRAGALGLVLLMLIVAGCGGSKKSTTPEQTKNTSGKQVELTLLPLPGISTQSIIDINEEFTRQNPNIKIRLKDVQQLQVFVGGQFNQAAFDGVDIMMMPNQQLRAAANAGIVKDLSAIRVPKLNEGAAQVYDDLGQVDGKRFGLAITVTPTLMQLNEQALGRAGVKMPSTDWTWQDFEQMAAAVQNAGGNVAANVNALLDPIVRSYGGMLYDPDKKAWVFDSPDALKGLSALGSMTSKNLVQMQGGAIRIAVGPGGGGPGGGGPGGGGQGAIAGGGQGQAAQGVQFAPAILAFGGGGPGFNAAGLTPFPYPKGPKGRFAPAGGTMVAVNATSANPEAAVEYVKHLLGASAQTFLAKGGMRPVIADSKALAAWQERVGDAQAKAIEAGLQGAYASQTPNLNEMINGMAPFFQGKAALEPTVSALIKTLK